MKKILTLMAAMSAASGAFAYDYEWNVPDNLATGNVAGTNDKLNYDGSALNFEVSANDQVLVTVYNTGDTKGSVSANGTSIEVEGKSTSVLDYTCVAGGPVSITFGGTIVVKSIKVISQDYKDVNDEIDAAVKAVNDINIKLAGYASTYPDFYNALMKQLNKQGQQIELVKAALKEAKENNDVAAQKTTLVNRLANVVTNVTPMPQDAEDAVAQYKALAETYSKTTTDQITKARKTANITKAEYAEGAINDLPVYIYNFKANANGAGVKDDIKAEWEIEELKTIEEAQKKLAKDALDELANYPNHFAHRTNDAGETEGMTVADFQQAYDQIGTDIENMISRARVEHEYKTKIDDLAEKVTKLDNVIAGNPDVFTKPNNYDTWAQGVKDIKDYIDKDDNREEKTWAELKRDIVDAYNTANTDLTTMMAALAEDAADKLQPIFDDAQKVLSDCSYKVTAKYQNEPETQKVWQNKFAVKQNELTGYGKSITDRDYDAIVVNYTTIKENIENVKTTAKGYWSEAVGDQSGEIQQINQTQADKLMEQVKEVRNTYNARVTEHIQKWLDQDFLKNNTQKTTDVKANLQKLFAIVTELEKVNSAIQTKVDELYKKIEEDKTKDDGAQFDPSDNKYRFFAETAEYTEEDGTTVKFTDKIASLKSDIEKELKEATHSANQAAYSYIKNASSWNGSAENPNYNSAYQYVDNAKDNVDEGHKSSLMSAAAATAYTNAYEDVRTAKYDAQHKLITSGYLTLADTYIREHNSSDDTSLDFDKHTLADNVKFIQDTYLKPVYTEVDKIKGELTSYKEQYATINDMKVQWNYVHAKETELQREAKAANPSEKDDYVATTVESMKKAIENCAKDLEAKALTASEQKTSTDKAKTDFDKDYKKLTEYKTVFDNEDNYAKATAKAAEVETAIKAAEVTIAAYRDEVKAEAQASLNGLKTQLDAKKTDIERDNANYQLGSTYSTIETALTSILDNVQTVLDKAKSDQEGGNLDVDDNPGVDINDVLFMEDKQETGEINQDTYYNFIDAYLKYMTNKK